MAATKLSVYNHSLSLLGDARLAALTDDVDARYVLDELWDEAVVFVLRQAPWRFALKTATLVPGGTALTGYAAAYAYPADWLRTHAIFMVHATDGREFPIDLRDEAGTISVNIGAPRMRYVANQYVDPAHAAWPEHFSHVVAAYLAFLAGERITGARGMAPRMSDLFASLLPEAIRVDALDEDRWLPRQRSGAVLRAAYAVLSQGFWRFALKTEAAVSGGSAAAGYSNAFSLPADCVQTHALYLGASGREFPFDVRQNHTTLSANVAAFTVRYVATGPGLDPRLWPEAFQKAVLAFLDAEEAGAGEGGERAVALYRELLAAGLASHADAPNPWLRYQLDGSFLPAARAVLGRGFWSWGLKETLIDTSQQLTTQAEYPFPYRYGLPSDHLRTHSLFVPWDGQECPINIRESAHDWSTDAPSFVARYLSTDVLAANGGADATKAWPELVGKAVLAYLDWQAAPAEAAKLRESEFARLLAEALHAHSRPEDGWLRFQLDGRFEQARKNLLEQGRWRFAIRTVVLTPSSDPLPAELSDGSVSNSYGYRFIRPNDLWRTIWVYYLEGSGTAAQRYDIDYRDEGGAFHANYTPITVRYVSRLGLDATKWPASYHDAVLAWLQYNEARADPKMAAQAAALFQMYEDRCRTVERLDDARDMPVVRNVGRFVQARRVRSDWDRKQGLRP